MRILAEVGAAATVGSAAAEPYDPARMSGMVQVALAADVAEAEELEEILHRAGIEATITPALADDAVRVLVPEAALEAAEDAIEALTEPDELIAEP